MLITRRMITALHWQKIKVLAMGQSAASAMIYQASTRIQPHTQKAKWGLIKIMGPFGVCIIVYTLQSRGPKGAHNFDQPPHQHVDKGFTDRRFVFRPCLRGLGEKPSAPKPEPSLQQPPKRQRLQDRACLAAQNMKPRIRGPRESVPQL